MDYQLFEFLVKELEFEKISKMNLIELLSEFSICKSTNCKFYIGKKMRQLSNSHKYDEKFTCNFIDNQGHLQKYE